MLQLPSNLAAIAGGAEQMIARALDRAKAQIRLPSMKVLMGIIRLIGEAPAKGGHTGASGSVGGTYDGGRQNPSQPSLYSHCVLRATPVHFSFAAILSPGSCDG